MPEVAVVDELEGTFDELEETFIIENPGKQMLLVQSQGSPRDPSYAEQMLDLYGEEVSFYSYFRRKGIKVLKEDLVNSCHGCSQLTLDLAGQIDELARQGHRIVAVQQGGLLFAKPSIEAANMPTVPVISIPLDRIAFLAPYVPSGTAVIGGVPVNGYQTAANVASAILNNTFEGVYTLNGSDRLKAKLDELRIPILGQVEQGLDDGLVVGTLRIKHGHYNIPSTLNIDDIKDFDSLGDMGVFTLANNDPEYVKSFAHFPACNNNLFTRSMYVRGDENIAFMAAKIMAAYHPDIAGALRTAAEKKAGNYQERNITLDAFI
ncbi:MAG: hypothetical protein V1740_06675 [Candidatus Woesearchaeota archaeon]